MKPCNEGLVKQEWKRLKTPQMLVKCAVGSTLMTSLTAYENISGGHAFTEYDQALLTRAPYTFFMSYVFLRVHELIKQRLPESRYKRPLVVMATSGLTTSATYLVQKLAKDPEAISSAGWTAILSLLSFTAVEVAEVLSKSKGKNQL